VARRGQAPLAARLFLLRHLVVIMARRGQAPLVADVISSPPSGCDRGPTGTSPARGEIRELNLRKGFLSTRANFKQPSVSIGQCASWRYLIALVKLADEKARFKPLSFPVAVAVP